MPFQVQPFPVPEKSMKHLNGNLMSTSMCSERLLGGMHTFALDCWGEAARGRPRTSTGNDWKSISVRANFPAVMDAIDFERFAAWDWECGWREGRRFASGRVNLIKDLLVALRQNEPQNVNGIAREKLFAATRSPFCKLIELCLDAVSPPEKGE